MDANIEAIMNKIKNGEVKTACVYALLDSYYFDLDDATFSTELLQLVENRNSGIAIALSKLLEDGNNVNEGDKCFNALMLAVGNGDAPMVHYLITHGADAGSWPNMEDTLPNERNYYLDDIDIHNMNECFANDPNVNYLNALYRTALVLVEDAHLGPYSGHSLKIDEDGNVSL